MSQHKSNPVTAIALVCKRGPERIERSFILSTASGLQIPITDCSSDVSLSTFSLTTISPLRLRQNHYNVDALHRLCYCLELTHTNRENKNMHINTETKRIASSELDFVLISRVSLMSGKAAAFNAQSSLLWFHAN